PRPVISPEVAADRHVTFRIKAANAKEVKVYGQWAKEPLILARDDQGVWVGTSPAPIDPGVWEYSMAVDGVGMIDPANSAIKPMREPRTSILDLPATPAQPWDFQDVPHGTVHQHDYLSKAFGVQRSLTVYTPPGYESATAESYPLLVLQHGSGDNQATWITHGHAHWILDNLIAAGKAKPMVVVMLFGHQPPASQAVPESGKYTSGLEAFRRELLDDALPLVESHYRLKSGPAARAITGLSMGGGQALGVGLAERERFAWVGAFSAAPPDAGMVKAALDDAAGTNRDLKLLWIAIGKDDFLRARNETFAADLTAHAIQHEFQITDGGHSWPVWRRYLVEFLPRLFTGG
ncbi:MAG: esterase, partial [Planctomycetes bacterium]|nr:esterase [Planctomycetota bacterium]